MRKVFLYLSLIALLLIGCAQQISKDDLFPAQVGSYLRTAGPSIEASTDADFSTYQGPEGAITLYIKQVATGQAQMAVEGLPPMASNVGYDPSLGQRQGSFFYYAGEFHATWYNGDSVFVLSASTDSARRAFLAAYGF